MAQPDKPAAPSTPADAPAESSPTLGPDPTDAEHTNRLIHESSPYLLQHAHNPVDWFPWGEEAFAEAKRRGVPIFISVGYSTCYWCHVMERESFEDPAVAALMNEKFVAIKVDREERPDVDDIYMAAVQMLTGQGGWPMNVFLTPPGAGGPDDPGLKPFWGGTYFPPEPRGNYPSFTMVLNGIADAWAKKRPAVLQQADTITDGIRDLLAARAEPAQIGAEQVSGALARLISIHDITHGGFGASPKFPQPVFLDFLLDVIPFVPEDGQRGYAEAALTRTLDAMALGGVFDQVGGGFHRYSTDPEWVVPHFEKMLYDQGQLLGVYARAADRYDDPFYARVARRTAEHALTVMRDDAGGFSSAIDAEVDGREGASYVWREDEIRAALPADDADFAVRVYQVFKGTNFQDPHHPDDKPANVLVLAKRPEALAEDLGLTEDEFLARLDRVNAALLAARAKRPQPAIDDKIIAGWNGLMIAGLADAGRLLDEPAYVEAAASAADFVLSALRDGDGAQRRSWRRGRLGPPAVLEDYAFLARGLLALDLALPGERGEAYRRAAETLIAQADAQFGDPEHGGWFDTRAGRADLVLRTRATTDGAVPSGQSVMIHNLLALHARTGDEAFLAAAGRGLASLSRAIAEAPLAPVESTRALIAVLRLDLLSDRDLLADFGLGESAPVFAPETPNKPPVEVFASATEVVVTPDAPATLGLEVRIADGWHINTHEPGIEWLAPLEVRVVGGTGVRAVVEYPTGEPLTTEWAPEGERPMVYKDSVVLSVRLERTEAPWDGEPALLVQYQACTDTQCAEPAQALLRVKIKPE